MGEAIAWETAHPIGILLADASPMGPSDVTLGGVKTV